MRRWTFDKIARGPEPADVIFVFAGREERKRFGIELFRQGFAPRLILSVGRFEWRRFTSLELPSDGGLTEMVQTIEAPKRHFFVHVDESGACCEWVPKGKLGTMTEARAVASIAARDDVARLLVVSSPEHLPRCRLALRRFLRGSCEIIPVPCAPSGDGSTLELTKYIAYWTLGVASKKRPFF